MEYIYIFIALLSLIILFLYFYEHGVHREMDAISEEIEKLNLQIGENNGLEKLGQWVKINHKKKYKQIEKLLVDFIDARQLKKTK